jgi:cytochrome P450
MREDATSRENAVPVRGDTRDVSAASDVYYDPYNVELNADPYTMFRQLREQAPLYYNLEYDFYALSRFADVDNALVDHERFSSARGGSWN